MRTDYRNPRLLMPALALAAGVLLFLSLNAIIRQAAYVANAHTSSERCQDEPCKVHLPLVEGGSGLPRPTPTPTPIVLGDLGDAPDSHGIGITMTAYVTDVVSGTTGNYPTVYVSGTRSGPFHHTVQPAAYFGEAVSAERNAHLLPDDDMVTNLAPDMDATDRDLADDSAVAAYGLEYPCAEADLTYTITIESGFESEFTLEEDPGTVQLPEPVEAIEVVYLNAWLDLDRDGSWQSSGQCDTVERYSEERGYWTDPAGASVSEWMIQDLPLTVEPGTHVFTTTVVTLNFTQVLEYAPTWLRLTLGGPLGKDETQDGRGPANGHRFGETEDIKLHWQPSPQVLPRAWWRG